VAFQVIVISGPNGAGKSTLAPILLKDKFGEVEFVNADPIAEGLSAFHPERVAFEAGRTMLKRLKVLARDRKSFAFETTLSTRSYASWVKKLQESGYKFHLIFLWVESPELSIARIRERVRAGGHDVPDTVVQRRYFRGVRNFFQLYKPLADTWAMYDNSRRYPELVAFGGRKRKTKVLAQNLWKNIQMAEK